MNENENENENALCCSLLLVLVFGKCSHLPFVAFLKNKSRQMPLVDHFGFLLLVLVFCRCFHLRIALLVLAFLVRKPKRATKGKKVQMETRL